MIACVWMLVSGGGIGGIGLSRMVMDKDVRPLRVAAVVFGFALEMVGLALVCG